MGSEFVYIINRNGELDVYASLTDAEEAAAIMGGAPIIEQCVFGESTDDDGPGSTRHWLAYLRREVSR